MVDFFIDIITGLFKGILTLLWDVLMVIFNRQPKRKEVLDADFIQAKKILSAFNRGFSLNGTLHATTKDSYMSAMVLASSGGGKTVTVCIPTLYNLSKHGHSVIINDPSGELYRASAGIFSKRGYSIKVLHYSNPDISDGYNPMFRATDASGLQKVASLLVRNALGENSKDPFWSTQSVLLISLLMRILKKQNPWYQNLANVKLLLDTMAVNSEAMAVIVAKCADREILSEYKQFVVMDKKLLVSIVSTCRAALAIFSDPSVQKLTAFDSIDFDGFRSEKTVLFIQNKTGEIKYYSTLSAIFFEQCFTHIMERFPEKNERSIFFVIDEASSLYLPSLQIALSNLRKFRAGIMTIAQDYNQYVHLYGSYEAEAIRSNSFSKIFFPGQSIPVCRDLEVTLGQFQYQDEQGNIKTRSLMSADEIRAMEPNTALIVCGSHRAIHTKMYPYYKNFKYRRLASLPMPELTSKLPFEELPLIPLPNKL